MNETYVKLIDLNFKKIFDIDTLVGPIEDDYIDYGIYDKSLHENTEFDELKSTYSPEFGISQTEDGEWFYLFLVVVHGDYDTPPEAEYAESNEKYKSFEDALLGLILHKVSDEFNANCFEVNFSNY